MLETLSCYFIGLYAGAMLTEAVIIVPQWKVIGAIEFNRLHKVLYQRFFRFFAPVTTLAVVFAQLNLVVKFINKQEFLYPAITALLMLLCLTTFFTFFKEANKKFQTTVFSDEAFIKAINTWHQVHWGRTVLALIAFVVSLL
jgi:hypothetical protein